MGQFGIWCSLAWRFGVWVSFLRFLIEFKSVFSHGEIVLKSIYVGNMAYSASEQDVRELFSQYGEVLSVKLIVDRDTGKAKGFGFVEMEDSEAEKAIDALNNSEFLGRNLRVNEAKPREPRDTKTPRY